MKCPPSPRYKAVETINGFGVHDSNTHRLTYYASYSTNEAVNEIVRLMMQTIAGLLTENDTEALEKYNKYKVQNGAK